MAVTSKSSSPFVSDSAVKEGQHQRGGGNACMNMRNTSRELASTSTAPLLPQTINTQEKSLTFAVPCCHLHGSLLALLSLLQHFLLHLRKAERESERERESVCVCVCVREREGGQTGFMQVIKAVMAFKCSTTAPQPQEKETTTHTYAHARTHLLAKLLHLSCLFVSLSSLNLLLILEHDVSDLCHVVVRLEHLCEIICGSFLDGRV